MTIAANDSNIVYSPYNWEVGSSYAGTIYAGAYFTVLIGTATAATLNFDATFNVGDVPEIWWRADQGPWTMVILGTGNQAVTITSALNADWQKHFIEVVVKGFPAFQNRWTSASQLVRFVNIATTPSNIATLPLTKRSLSAIIYGDSITEGIASAHAIGSTSPEATAYDALACYSYLLRDAIGIEIGVVGLAGTGWLSDGSGTQGAPSFANNWNFMRAGVTRALSPAPDLIVINQGNNDGANNIVSTATATLNSLLAATPATTLIAVIRPFGGNQATNLQAAIAACASPARVSYVDSAGWWVAADSSDSTHPWGYAHQSIVRQLAQALRVVLGRGATYLNVAGTAKKISPVRI